jgi:hypothetical protein
METFLIECERENRTVSTTHPQMSHRGIHEQITGGNAWK